MKKSRKSLRSKLVMMVAKNFLKDHLFDQVKGADVELKKILKRTFSFKCELTKFENINFSLFAEIIIEREDGEMGAIHFNVVATVI